MERKDMGMNDILPPELIHRIFLRVPAKDLFRLRFVSKLWHSLISDGHFAESHYNLYSAASSHSYYFLVHDYTKACFVQLHTLFDVPAAPTTLKEIPLVINPDHKVPYGFGFDASRDDYLVVLSWPDNYNQHHLDCFSLRTNSWINLDAALPKSMGTWKQQFYGLFLHGAIHWLCYSSQDYIDDAILIFDLKERSFSKISMPKQLVGCSPINLTILGGCLALYWYHDDITEIWVMKEYKVPSSWILICEIPCGNYLPLCISNGSNIIALNFELGPLNSPRMFRTT
ncbi:hypothetical protein Ahy_B04g071229 [Arachis hypogaea]|uniref:F-box domain-containing protein n=1 Tax=Arachis hypogaea TaxID=3818 RepID=A0A444ZKB3_ARAHY|nr:hypothetical protein Ahy_B04g071229 [Arachis hypogaea]